ncbi:hypothetical protein [Protaetiibacter larvae]|uniref:Uncharacterized protein n=1 Tax=Protaetiibacter larvae TaxID=2592654 RepID=A0A5C1Y9H0_9MICO|nr:hypothetical protein [Protaetiibacter larvae]QEO10531.1 hypothetical protein FLP23_11285 [Protaetiibacter larvae]
MSAREPQRRARHRAPRRPLDTARGLLGTAAAVAGTTITVVALSSGSLASWVDSATVTPGVVSTGSAELDVTASFTAANWSNLLVGESVRQSFTVTNLGDVPFTLSATGTSTAAGYELRTAPGACPGTALGGASITTTAASLGTLAAGATTTACLEVRLVAGAAAGSTSAVNVTVTGTQVP